VRRRPERLQRVRSPFGSLVNVTYSV
jgi:hypothetical protein